MEPMEKNKQKNKNEKQFPTKNNPQPYKNPQEKNFQEPMQY